MGVSAGFKPVGAHFEEVYNHLKEARKKEPVFYSEAYGCWVVTRYDDLVDVVMDERYFTAEGSLYSLNNNYGEDCKILLNQRDTPNISNSANS